MIGALFAGAGEATGPDPCPRILTLGYLSRATVRNLGPEPSESAFTASGAASVRKLGVGSGGTAEVCDRDRPVVSIASGRGARRSAARVGTKRV